MFFGKTCKIFSFKFISITKTWPGKILCRYSGEDPFSAPSQSCNSQLKSNFKNTHEQSFQIKKNLQKHEVTSCKHYSSFFSTWQRSLHAEVSEGRPGGDDCPPFTHKHWFVHSSVNPLEVTVKFLHIFPHKCAARLSVSMQMPISTWARSQILGSPLQLFLAPPLRLRSLAQSDHHRLHVFRGSPFPHEEVNHALRLDH